MVEFGDELILIESFKIPWLIWIQLLVMILLVIILLFGLTVFTSDASVAASPPSGRSAAAPAHLNNPTSSNRIIKVEELRAETSQGSTREDNPSREESSPLKDPTFLSIFQRPNHPCNYIGLAKRALLKCFGLDSSSESSSNSRHEKQE